MLAKLLNDTSLQLVLINSDKTLYLGKELIKQVNLLARVFSCVGVSSTDTVGIYCTNEFHGIATILACLHYGANFTVLDTSDNIEDTKVKIVLANVSRGLIISEEVIDDFILTINPETFQVMSKGWNYFTLETEEQTQISQIFKIINSYYEEKKIDRPEELTSFFTSTINPELLMGIVFHEGISKGIFNASKITHTAIIKGIEDAVDNYPAKTGSNVIVVEPFNLLYNIVNGILAPMLNKIVVKIGNNKDFIEITNSIKMSTADVVYISAPSLEETLTILSKEIINIPILKKYRLRRLFKSMFGKYAKHYIIVGEIKNRKIINTMKKKYSTLYVMNEIVSYIASATYHKIPKHQWLKPRLNVSLTTQNNENTYGEIGIVSDDMFHSYLYEGDNTKQQDVRVIETLPKDVDGNFKTEDIGLSRNGKILIKGKAKHIFINENGVVIENGKILLISNRFKVVKTATIVVKDDRLLLVVEPDFDYINEHYTSMKDVDNKFKELFTSINGQVHKYSKVYKIIRIANPAGLYRKNYKIISSFI